MPAINFISQLAHVVLPSAFVLYAGYRYNWDATMVGITLAIVGACSMVVQALLIGPFVKRFGERRSALFGFAFGAAGFAVYALAPVGYLSWLGIPLQAMWGLSNPSIQSLMSRLVSPSEQGQLQGANTSVASIAQLVRPGHLHADAGMVGRQRRADRALRRAVPAGRADAGGGGRAVRLSHREAAGSGLAAGLNGPR